MAENDTSEVKTPSEEEKKDFAERVKLAEAECAVVLNKHNVKLGATVNYSPDGITARVVFVNAKENA